jgi:hypothetical protein
MHPLLHEAVAALLASESDMTLVAEAPAVNQRCGPPVRV